MYRYQLILSYDGTNYAGWQLQPNALSIQEIVEEKLSIILQQPIKVTGCGRTDSGVHAKEQVTHFDCNKELQITKTKRSLNGLLPFDIRALELNLINSSFHARYSAKRKVYCYYITQKETFSPFTKRYRAFIPFSLDIDQMKKGASYLIGTHNFLSFANSNHEGSAAKDPVRTIYRIDFIEDREGFRIEYEGSGFLYKMVRNLTGCLIEIGKGHLAPEKIIDILEAKNRKMSFATAPASGLFLEKVFYDQLS